MLGVNVIHRFEKKPPTPSSQGLPGALIQLFATSAECELCVTGTGDLHFHLRDVFTLTVSKCHRLFVYVSFDIIGGSEDSNECDALTRIQCIDGASR